MVNNNNNECQQLACYYEYKTNKVGEERVPPLATITNSTA